MNPPSLGKLVAIHGVSPAYIQRAAVVAGLSFAFFVAMMAAFYVRAQFGYFLLATAFLVVLIFTLIGWLMQRRNVVEIYDRGLRFRGRDIAFELIAGVVGTSDGGLRITTSDDRSAVEIPRSVRQLPAIGSYIEERTRQSA